jgi:hypothetical protein
MLTLLPSDFGAVADFEDAGKRVWSSFLAECLVQPFCSLTILTNSADAHPVGTCKASPGGCLV